MYAYGRERIIKFDDNYVKEFFEYDHPGNTRISYMPTYNCLANTNSYIISNATDYYPYGKVLRSFSGSGLGRYGYQSSEREKEIGDDDYYTLFRGLDAEIGRWKQFDPKWNQSWSPYVSMDDNPVIHTDYLGDVVDYGKIGQGGLRNRINSGLSRIFSNNYRQQFNNWQSSTQTFTLNKVNNMPSLKSGGQLSAGANPNQTMVNYGGTGLGIESKGLTAFGTTTKTLHDNNSNNNATTQKMRAVVPGSTVTVAPLGHPDEFTFNDQAGTLVQQFTAVATTAALTYTNLVAFSPVNNLTIAPKVMTFAIPAGTSSMTLIQRSNTLWPVLGSTPKLDGNSQWDVSYTKYRLWLPVIR